jgi:hypothetical protein
MVPVYTLCDTEPGCCRSKIRARRPDARTLARSRRKWLENSRASAGSCWRKIGPGRAVDSSWVEAIYPTLEATDLDEEGQSG